MRNLLIAIFALSLIFTFTASEIATSFKQASLSSGRYFPDINSVPKSNETMRVVIGYGDQKNKEEALVNAIAKLISESPNTSLSATLNEDNLIETTATSNTDIMNSVGKININTLIVSDYNNLIGTKKFESITTLSYDDRYYYEIKIEETNMSLNKVIRFTDSENSYEHIQTFKDDFVGNSLLESSEAKISDIFFDSLIDELEKNNIKIYKMVTVNSFLKNWYYKNLSMGDVAIVLIEDKS